MSEEQVLAMLLLDCGSEEMNNLTAKCHMLITKQQAENAALKEQVAQLEAEATKWKEACRKEYLSAIDWAGKTQAAEIDLDTLQSKSAALVVALETAASRFRNLSMSDNSMRCGVIPSVGESELRAALAAFKGEK